MRLKTNEAAIVKLRLKNYNEISNNKQTCIVSNHNSQRSFSVTKSGLYVLLNTLEISITIQSRKMGYALAVKIRYKMTENKKKLEVLDFPNHKDNICILSRLEKIKISSGLAKSHKSETDDGFLSCLNFPERTP